MNSFLKVQFGNICMLVLSEMGGFIIVSPLALYHYLFYCDWFPSAIIICHTEGYYRHNSSSDNNLHTIVICPDVIRTARALEQRMVCHAPCQPLSFFICKGKAAADMIQWSREQRMLFSASSWRFICPRKHDILPPLLLPHLSVDTATLSHHPWTSAWHSSGGLWEYSAFLNHCLLEVKGYSPSIHSLYVWKYELPFLFGTGQTGFEQLLKYGGGWNVLGFL